MSKRFIIAKSAQFSKQLEYEVIHDFCVSDQWAATHAFNTLYNGQAEYVLFEQVACSEPAGSCAESEHAGGETEV